MQAENEAADAWRGGAAWANAAMIRWVRVLEKGVALLKRLLITAGIVVVGSVGLSMLVTLPAAPAAAADTRIARGKYLSALPAATTATRQDTSSASPTWPAS